MYPSREVLTLKTEKVLEYLRTEQERGSNYNRRCKLVLIGTRGSGKTTLIHLLRSRGPVTSLSTIKGTDTKKTVSTEEWILTPQEVVQSQLDSSDDDHDRKTHFQQDESQIVRFTIWDYDERAYFAPMFVSPRSVFLYVWNMQADANLENFSYWMELVKRRAPGCPVIVVGTHADVKSFSSDALKDYQQFYNIKQLFEVSAKDGKNFDLLRTTIFREAANMDSVRLDLPVLSRKALEFFASKRAQGNIFCERSDLEKHLQGDFKDVSEIEKVLEDSSQLGLAFDFHSYLLQSSSMITLEPKQIIECISCIFVHYSGLNFTT